MGPRNVAHTELGLRLILNEPTIGIGSVVGKVYFKVSNNRLESGFGGDGRVTQVAVAEDGRVALLLLRHWDELRGEDEGGNRRPHRIHTRKVLCDRPIDLLVVDSRCRDKA